LLRLVLAVQDKSLDSLPLPHLCAIHAVLAIIMSIIVPISVLRDPLLDHVQCVSLSNMPFFSFESAVTNTLQGCGIGSVMNQPRWGFEEEEKEVEE
uniref:G_PROTEIN_RECEP_F1_2 domain-containing protein n=1 Tax=Rodentolepis nana TaxID=102285 RepID=A0A0R3TIC6_RODNA